MAPPTVLRRLIAGTIWQSPQFMALSSGAQLLFIGIITTSDDQGRRTANPTELLVDIFPGNVQVTEEDVQVWTAELVTARDGVGVSLIEVYYEGGKTFSWLPKWAIWQTAMKYIKPSKIPPPPGFKPAVIPPNLDIKTFVDWFFEEFQKRTGKCYLVKGAKETSLTRAMLRHSTLEELKAYAMQMFENPDPFTARAGWSITTLYNIYNRLVQGTPPGERSFGHARKQAGKYAGR